MCGQSNYFEYLMIVSYRWLKVKEIIVKWLIRSLLGAPQRGKTRLRAGFVIELVQAVMKNR